MRLWLTLAAALAAFSVSDAYTATNAVAPARAGAGAGAISGYAVADVRYELDGDVVSSVSFSLDPPGARTARIRLSATGAWHPCALMTGTADCPLPSVAVDEIDRLDVVASG